MPKLGSKCSREGVKRKGAPVKEVCVNIRGCSDAKIASVRERVAPSRIELLGGKLLLTKKYAYYVAEPEIIRQAIMLATNRIVEAQKIEVDLPTEAVGMPFRGDAGGSGATENVQHHLDLFYSRYRSRAQAREKSSLGDVLVAVVCVVAWPVGLSIWARRKNRRQTLRPDLYVKAS